MADDSVRRYCPHCAAFGNRYTMWTTYMGGLGVCENDRGSGHKVNMRWGKYRYDIGMRENPYRPAQYIMERAVFTDNGIIYDGAEICLGMFEATIGTMEAEVATGLFEPSMWFDTFPCRSTELLTQMEEVVEGELDRDLPPPLIGIITAYLWALP